MARRILWSGSVTLPAPTSITVNDEIIWTSDTGRTLAGYMVGDPVAEKKTVSIKWGILTEAQMAVIKVHWFRGISHFRSVMTESILRYSHTGEHCQKNRLDG